MKVKVQRISEKDYEKIFIMTDIHGRYDLFEKIFDEINFTKNDLLIILGDSCDRGEFSYEMYRKYIDLQNEGYKVIHLLGNHEDTILKSRNDLNHKANWMFNGGERTVYSFFRHQNKFEEIIDYWEEFYKEKSEKKAIRFIIYIATNILGKIKNEKLKNNDDFEKICKDLLLIDNEIEIEKMRKRIKENE